MDAVNWDAVAASAEVIGVIALLGSILYLARQVAQGNKLNQADSIRAFLGQYSTFLYKINEPEMLEIWRRGTTDFESLTDHEKSRLHLVLMGHFMLGQAQRMIDPEGSEPLSQFADFATGTVIQQPGFKQWWNTFTPGLPDQEYIKRIDNYPASRGFRFEEFMPWFSPDEAKPER
jgi:hypothetical protein